MKKVSMKFITCYALIWIIFYLCGAPMTAEWGIPLAVKVSVLLVWLYSLFGYPWFYPKRIDKRIIQLAKEKNIKGIGFRSEFFFPESYLIDSENGYLIGLMLLNPFQFQYMDLKEVKDVEVITKVFNQSVVASVRIRMHMAKGKYDIWMYRDARYAPRLIVGGGKEMTTMEYAVKVKECLLDGVKTAKQIR